MIACVVCLFIALVAISAGLCFKTNSLTKLLLHSALLVATICLGVCSAAYKSKFGGFEILLFVSVVPLFLQICVLQPQNGLHEENVKHNNNLPKNGQNLAENGNLSIKHSSLLDYLINFVYPTALLASAICIFFCGLYVGKESFYGVLVAIAIALFATFLDAIIKKDYHGKSKKEIVLTYAKNFVLYFSVGFLLSAALLALAYKFSATNILFAVGAVTFAAHNVLERYKQSKYNHLFLTAAYALMFVAVLV